MTRPVLRSIPLASVQLGPGTVVITLSVGQWDNFLSVAYALGYTLLELDDNERPVAAYQRGAPS
jgi:hypothetical protein